MQQSRRFTSTVQRGFTLIELSIVVAIVAVIIAVSLQVAPQVMADNRANSELKELPSVIAKTQKIYANKASFTGATIAGLIANNVWAPDRVVAGNVINRWSGNVTMALSGANMFMTLTYTMVPNAECAAVTQGIEGAVNRIDVNGTTILDKSVAATSSIDPMVAGAACNSAVGTNTIAYTFAH